MADKVRIVEVERAWYVALLVSLLPTERWYDQERKGIVLYAFDHSNGESTQLVFKPKGVGMDPLFQFHKLNEEGQKGAVAIAEAFDECLKKVGAIVGAGTATREFSLAKTHLEEACFYAKKSLANQPRYLQE